MDEPRPESTPACCDAHGADPRVARAFDGRYEEWTDADELPEMVDVSARLLDHLADATTVRPSVLELGCGTGSLGVALLEMGASRVRGIDLSPASVAMAKRRAEAGGWTSQAEFEVGDAGTAPLEPHDWVVLDRVICCDGHVERLLANAIGAARSRIAISAPESRGWRGFVNRPLWTAEYVLDLLSGGCRGYVHDLRRVERRLTAAGFRRVTERSSHLSLWFIAVYERPSREERAPA